MVGDPTAITGSTGGTGIGPKAGPVCPGQVHGTGQRAQRELHLAHLDT